MSAQARKQSAITLGVLLRSEPMRDVVVRPEPASDEPVVRVQLVDDVEQVRRCEPGTVVVLQRPIAAAAWSVSVAIRYAWERRLPCVVAQLDPQAAPSVVRLAERLDVPLGHCPGDLAHLALALAPLVALPAATRSQTVTRCASAILEQQDASSVLRVIQQNLPDVEVTLRAAGRGAHPVHHAEGTDVRTVTVPFGPLDPWGARELRAEVTGGSPEWLAVVSDVLAIARAQILACEAGSLVRLSARRATEESLLLQVTEHDGLDRPDVASAARELGWVVDGGLVAGLVSLPDHAREEVSSLDGVLPAIPDATGPVRYDAGWAYWMLCRAADETEGVGPDGVPDGLPSAVSAQRTLAVALGRIRDDAGLPRNVATGVGSIGRGPAGLGRSLRHAVLAAKAARLTPAAGPAPVYDEVGASAFLVGADTADLRPIAREVLAPLADCEDVAALVQTIATYLDCGGSTARAATALGVHRNTVSGRMERVRRLGVPVDDPARRLVLHLAAHLEAQRLRASAVAREERTEDAPSC